MVWKNLILAALRDQVAVVRRYAAHQPLNVSTH